MNPADIAARLIAAREAGGHSQAAVARVLDMHPQQLARYEAGRVPDWQVLVRLARLYGVTLDHLLGLDGQAPELTVSARGLSASSLRLVRALIQKLRAADAAKEPTP